jgi:hypothetical protein
MSKLTEWQSQLGMSINMDKICHIEALLRELDDFWILDCHKEKIRNHYPELYTKYFSQPDISKGVAADEALCRKYLNKLKNAKDRGLDFNLSLTSIKNIMRSKKCYYTGLPLTIENSTIDRVDSKVGYSKGNVVACHHEVNQLKSLFEDKSCMDKKQLKQMLKKWGEGL